jgi:hypothetical protein
MKEKILEIQKSAKFGAEKLHYLELSPLFLQFGN